MVVAFRFDRGLEIASRSSHVFTASAFYLVLGVLFISPLLWGATRPWGWYPMQLGIFAAFLISAIGVLLSQYQSEQPRRYPPPVIGLSLLGFLALVLIQVVPLPAAIASVLAPTSAEHFDFMTDAVKSISVDRGATSREFLIYASYVCAYMVLYIGLSKRSRVLAMIICLVCIALLEAVFGVYAMYNEVYVVPERYLDGHFFLARGTYVNPNHYAGYLVAVGALVLGMIYAGIVERWEDTEQFRISDLIAELGTPTGLWLLVLAIIVTGIGYSSSRGAPAAGLLSLCLVVAISVFQQRKADLHVILPLIFVILIAVIWLGAGKFVVDVYKEGVDLSSRLKLWLMNVEVIKSYWLFGSGAGTFALVFSGVRDGSLGPLKIDTPHNDYLESLTEIGVIGITFLAIFVITTLVQLAKAFVVRRNSFYRGVLFGSLIAILSTLIHSIVEFNFRIPANALLFFAICALGLKATTLSDRRRI